MDFNSLRFDTFLIESPHSSFFYRDLICAKFEWKPGSGFHSQDLDLRLGTLSNLIIALITDNLKTDEKQHPLRPEIYIDGNQYILRSLTLCSSYSSKTEAPRLSSE